MRRQSITVDRGLGSFSRTASTPKRRWDSRARGTRPAPACPSGPRAGRTVPRSTSSVTVSAPRLQRDQGVDRGHGTRERCGWKLPVGSADEVDERPQLSRQRHRPRDPRRALRGRPRARTLARPGRTQRLRQERDVRPGGFRARPRPALCDTRRARSAAGGPGVCNEFGCAACARQAHSGASRCATLPSLETSMARGCARPIILPRLKLGAR